MGHVLQSAVSAKDLETERQAEKMYMYSRSSIVQTGPIICAIGMIIKPVLNSTGDYYLRLQAGAGLHNESHHLQQSG